MEFRVSNLKYDYMRVDQLSERIRLEWKDTPNIDENKSNQTKPTS